MGRAGHSLTSRGSLTEFVHVTLSALLLLHSTDILLSLCDRNGTKSLITCLYAVVLAHRGVVQIIRV